MAILSRCYGSTPSTISERSAKAFGLVTEVLTSPLQMRTWSAETLILCLLQDISFRIRISCRVSARIRLCHQAIPLRITRGAQRDTSIIRLFRIHSLNSDRRHPWNYITRLAAASHNARSTSTVCRTIITRGGETASFSTEHYLVRGQLCKVMLAFQTFCGSF